MKRLIHWFSLILLLFSSFTVCLTVAEDANKTGNLKQNVPSNTVTPHNLDREEVVTVTLEVDNGVNFIGSINQTKKVLTKGNSLNRAEIPLFESNEKKFLGWEVDGDLLTEVELSAVKFNEDKTVTARFTEPKKRLSPRGVAASIKDIISGADLSKLIVVPSPAGDNAPFKEYDATEIGFKTALFYLYQNGANKDFTIYVGSNITLNAPTCAEEIPPSISIGTMTLSSLDGKVASLTFTGNSQDEITDLTTLAPGSKTLRFPVDVYFGSDITFRNLAYSFSNMYLQGNDISLAGGSFGSGSLSTSDISIYGGTNIGNVTGSPTITVNSTGSSRWSFYGGNREGGTLTGNPTIKINNTSGNIENVVGGAYIGKVEGDTSVTINDVAGNLKNFFGGGYGTNASLPAEVKGNVTSVINNQNPMTTMNLSNQVVGGINYGVITGVVKTMLSGFGKITSNHFVGGANYGQIGSSVLPSGVVTNYDTSQFSQGDVYFTGGNLNTGVIYGDVDTVLRSGREQGLGSIADFTGGSGSSNSTNGELSGSVLRDGKLESDYDNLSKEERKEIAVRNSKMRIHGNISNKILGGSVQNSYLYGASGSRGGAVIGDISIEVGEKTADGKMSADNIVYRHKPPTAEELKYSSTKNDWANAVDNWDLVGAGGRPGAEWSNYVYGNTKTVINNSVMRWTYGGGYSGVIDGDSSIVLNAGLLDTCEGGGYNNDRIYGNTKATVYNGQVNWFLTGGGWNDKTIVGDVGVNVYNGVINASMGASYGTSSGHTVTGNSDNRIYGGDFSGTPRTGANGFSGGITNSGSLLGNAKLTIDLRNYDNEFKLPSNTFISGGRPYDHNTNLGTDESNTITLNIFTKPGVNSLNGADIYGDGGGSTNSASSAKSGKIIMNIQATGSKIGKLYATQYSNTITESNKTRWLRDVVANVQGAESIAGLSGGSGSDNLTNTIYENGTAQSIFNFGADVDGTGNFPVDPIDVTGIGVNNFTQLNVTNGVKLMSSSGNIRNGLGATAANHGTSYHKFGTISLSKGGGIGISSSTGYISGGLLEVDGTGTIESPPGTGKINVSDFLGPDELEDTLTWIKNTTGDEVKQVNSNGTWFGAMKAYQVLTFNPQIQNAKNIIPFNFRGIEKATGKTFIGDNDVKTSSSNGYGLAIPGSTIDYEVEKPPIAEGKGFVTHNVSEVKVDNQPLAIKVWGSDIAGEKVQKGRLIMPSTNGINPTISLIPEITTTESWIYHAEVTSSQVGSTPVTYGEQSDSQQIDWSSSDGTYSYQVKVKYSNGAQVDAKNVIITESEAATLNTDQSVIAITGATGRPFLTSQLSADELSAIRQPLNNGDISRTHEITFKAGDTTTNYQTKTIKLIVVKDGSVVAAKRNFAIYAKDVQIKLQQANALADVSDLAKYTKAIAIHSDESTDELSLPADVFTSIQQANASELTKDVSTKYSYTFDGETLNKTVNVSVGGELKLIEVPSDIDFGTVKVSTAPKTNWPVITGNLTVKDTRGTQRSPWKLTVKEEKPLTLKNKNFHLSGCLSFIKQNQETILGSFDVLIEEKELTSDQDYIVNQSWGAVNQSGLKLTVPVELQIKGDYEGKLSWSLVSAPSGP
ncbi:MAG: hypothetical protein LBS33_04645 [Streptococcaceae bacterium]|jgi:hypothetical protein|nr:hypothetical protein [Streptococcaceae bacterium]